MRPLKVSKLPWMVIGDFNAILDVAAASNGTSPGRSGEDFQSWVDDMQLVEHRMAGEKLTWVNKQDNNLIVRKIDRVLDNSDWFGTHIGSMSSKTVPRVMSDNYGILVNSSPVRKTLP
ncbi:unnamed protein product [Linum trigynum]|uniref:Uncharacterized protein n=1 Tax=Linum trigynum TaxID=586398 RepID=A0AAV2DC35_9ROSI